MRTPLGVLAKVRPAEQGLDLAPLALAGLALALVWTLAGATAAAGASVVFSELNYHPVGGVNPGELRHTAQPFKKTNKNPF